MSRSAVTFLLMALCSLAAALLLPPQATQASMALEVFCAVSAGLCLLALVKGRKFKFDPLLR